MAREIKSDKLYMKGIFENWYRIPEYQRPFVWEPEQVLELLTDIEYALQNHPEGEYFLGSMVLCAKKKGKVTWNMSNMICWMDNND